MSELIDVACDICGKQYRWPDERLGETASCRYCGTKFEVKLYVPPEDDTNAKDLQWFKGVGIAILVVSVAVGLSSLLFIRPGQTGWNFANRSAPSSPAHLSSTTFRHSGPSHNPFSDIARNRSDQQARFEPNPVADAPTIIPVPAAIADTGLITAPPVITGWELVKQGFGHDVRIKGENLNGLTSVKTRLGSSFIDCNYARVFETHIDANGLHVRPGEVTIFTLTNPKGMAVVFSDDIKTVSGRETLDRREIGAHFYLVQKGGHFTCERPVGVLVETGGHAEMDPWASIGIVKGGGGIKSKLSLHLILEPGASVYPEPKNVAESTQPVITFYRLPVIAR